MKLARTTIAALCIALPSLCAGPALADQTPPSALLQAKPLDSGGAASSGSIDVLGQTDWYFFDAPPGLTLQGVEVMKTNVGCGIQASLTGPLGDRLGGVLVGDKRSEDLRVISPVAQRYYVAVDDGTLDFCTGAAYTIKLLPSQPVDVGQVTTSSAHAVDAVACSADTEIVDQLLYRVRHDRNRATAAAGRAKRSWTARLQSDKHTLASWRARVRRDCGI